MSLLAPAGSKIIFCSDFTSPASVARNGGVVTGSPTINGQLSGVSNANYVTLPDKGVTGRAVTYLFKGITFNALSGATQRIIYSPQVSISLNSSNKLVFSIPSVPASATPDTTNLTAGVKYNIAVVFDDPSNTVSYFVNTAITGTVAMVSSPTSRGSILIPNTSDSGDFSLDDFVISDSAMTEAELVDYFEGDTLSELDASRALVDLDFRSSFWKPNGVALGTDLDMQAADTSAYGTINATLSKVLTDTPDGQKLVLRVTRTGSSSSATQPITTVGARYRVTGWVRSGGVNTWQVSNLDLIDFGGDSTEWQHIDSEFVSTNSQFRWYAAGTVGEYVDYYNFRIERLEAQTENKGSLGGHALLSDGSITSAFPTFVKPHELIFDGGDHARIVQVLPSDTYSIVMALKLTSTDARYLFDFRNLAGAGAGYCYYTGSGTVTANGGLTNYVNGIATNNFDLGKLNTLIVQGMAGEVLDRMVIGGRYDFTFLATMRLFAFKIFRGTLTAEQARIEHARLLKMLNV